MSKLGLSADEVLSTTRAVRKRLDFERPVPIEVIHECLELALQAPTGSNAQGWHFVVVTDAEKRGKIAELYKQTFQAYRDMPNAANKLHADDPVMAPIQERVFDSAAYLAEHLHEVPVFVIPCIEGRVESVPGAMAVLAQASAYGSIIPAAWSFMLAARERGLGTCWTTLHLIHEKTVAELLGIPQDEITQVALIPVAYTVGTSFKAGPRKPLDGLLHVDRW
ncbi:MAG: nitroreductase family protein [Proteobacteria bacterium]|nr:nitroreductase family protein [Pseudomonadota bacterium]